MDPFTQIGWFVRWKPPLFTQSMKKKIDSVGVCAPRINTKTSKSVSLASPSGVGDTGQLITHHNKSYTCTVFVLYIYYI